jgi:membrane protease YdiL (CAAX protease family)
LGLLLVFACLLHYLGQAPFKWKALNISLWTATLILGLFIAIYRPSDFNYPLIWSTPQLYEGGQAYSLYANLGKGLGGYLVIAYLLKKNTNNTPPAEQLKALCASFTSVLALLMVAAVFFGVGWQPKLPSGVLYFAMINLFITVMAEEAFFRLLIQKTLSSFFQDKTLGVFIAAVMATLIFTLSHTTTLGPALYLYCIAGALYSSIYAYTQQFSLAVAVHFGTNLFHFLLLEYPMLL